MLEIDIPPLGFLNFRLWIKHLSNSCFFVEVTVVYDMKKIAHLKHLLIEVLHARMTESLKKFDILFFDETALNTPVF